jgi:hypothetical protein
MNKDMKKLLKVNRKFTYLLGDEMGSKHHDSASLMSLADELRETADNITYIAERLRR